MKTYTSLLTGTTAACVLLAASTQVHAKGRITIEPKIYSGIQYDSNFWKAEDEETGVNTYYIRPGIVAGYQTAKSHALLDMTVDSYWYSDQDTPPADVRDSSDDDFIGFTGMFDSATQATARLQLGLRDSLNYTRDPASSDVANNSVAREKYTINRFSPYLVYTLGAKSSIGAEYRNTYTDYTEDLGGEDSNENRGIFDLKYALNSKSLVYGEYSVWQRDYENATSAYLSNEVTLNYEYVYNFFTLSAGAGYHNRTFDIDAYEDIDVFAWNIALKGKEKLDENSRKYRYWVDLSLSSDFNDAGSGEEYFIATIARAEAGYRFFGKLETSAELKFQNSDYQNDPDNREDDKFNASLRLAYDVHDYVTFGVEGGIENRDSNIEGKSYDNTFVLATLDFHYPFGGK